MTEYVSTLRYYITIEMLSVETPWVTPFDLQVEIAIKEHCDEHLRFKSEPSTTAQKLVVGQQSNSLKKKNKRDCMQMHLDSSIHKIFETNSSFHVK